MTWYTDKINPFRISKDGKRILLDNNKIDTYQILEECDIQHRVLIEGYRDFSEWTLSQIKKIEQMIINNSKHLFFVIIQQPEKMEYVFSTLIENVYHGVEICKKCDISKTNYLPAFCNCFVLVHDLQEDLYFNDKEKIRYCFIDRYYYCIKLLVFCEDNCKQLDEVKRKWYQNILEDVEDLNQSNQFRKDLKIFMTDEINLIMKDSFQHDLPYLGKPNKRPTNQ